MANRASGANGTSSSGFALHCRGHVQLHCGQSDCTPKSKKGRALLAILAAEQRPMLRTRLIDLLWSDRQEEQARASLRTLLADLRSQFNSRFDELLIVDRERIALGSEVRTDLIDATLARPAGELFEGLDHIDPELDEWLRVEREKWAGAIPQTRSRSGEPAAAKRHGLKALLVLLALCLVAAGVYFRPWAAQNTPVIAVLKFKDLTARNAALANGLAEQLRIELAQYPDIGVIGSSSVEAKELEGKDLPAIASLLDATHVLEGTVVPHDGQVQLSLRLYERDRKAPIWTAHVPATGEAIVAGPSIAPAIAELVGDVARRPVNDRAFRADGTAYSELFEARFLKASDDPHKVEQARRILFETVSRYPEFVPALVSLSKATMIASSRPVIGIGTMPIDEARRESERYARRAIALAPDYGPAYNALGFALSATDAALGPYCKAAKLSPGSAEAQTDCGYALERKGDMKGAVAFRGAAAHLDPMNLPMQWNYANDLLYAGRRDEARAVIRDYLARGIPDEKRFQMISASEVNMFGDWSNGYIAAAQALRISRKDPLNDQNMMWPMLLMYGPRAALPFARKGSMSELILRDDLDAVIRRVGALGDEFWRLEYETPATQQYLLSKRRPDVLVAAYDRARAHGAPADALNSEGIIVALRMAGRSGEADYFVKDAGRRIAAWKGSSMVEGAKKVAMQAALAHRNDDAIHWLRIAHLHAWWASSEPLDHPYNNFAFIDLRRDPRFRELVRDYDRQVDRERRETQAEAKRLGLTLPPRSPPPPARIG